MRKQFSTITICWKGYTCDKADKWRPHWVVRSKLAEQLKGSFLVRCIRRSLHQNLPEGCKVKKLKNVPGTLRFSCYPILH